VACYRSAPSQSSGKCPIAGQRHTGSAGERPILLGNKANRPAERPSSVLDIPFQQLDSIKHTLVFPVIDHVQQRRHGLQFFGDLF
jgi:hypothetical protein